MSDSAHLATLDSLRTGWVHDGAAADAVRSIKYRRATALVSTLADELADRAPAVDLVTWCPASPAGRRDRGFDQSELLARAIAHRLRRPARRLLRRVDTTPQTGKDRRGRLTGPALRPARSLRTAPRVLLVDDVATTGMTLSAAGRLLREAGAREVHGLVVTRARRRGSLARG